jgi:hypothetical protein
MFLDPNEDLAAVILLQMLEPSLRNVNRRKPVGLIKMRATVEDLVAFQGG